MNYRECVIFTGAKFLVPDHIQRIDTIGSKTGGPSHGWQVRYGEWRYFSDHSSDGSGAQAALAEATEELIRRIYKLDAPTGLRKTISIFKKNQMPAGISGPILRLKKNRSVAELNFGVTIPRFGGKPTTKSIYIATENTLTTQKYELALAKAIEVRRNAEIAFQKAATTSRRRRTKAIKAIPASVISKAG